MTRLLLAREVRRRERALDRGLGVGAPCLAVRARERRAALVAEELSHPAHRALVGDAGEHELRAVVVDDGLRPLAVDRVELREVLPDGHQLNTNAGGRRGELGEAGDGSDVPGLVEQDQQRRVKRLVRARVAVIGGRITSRTSAAKSGARRSCSSGGAHT